MMTGSEQRSVQEILFESSMEVVWDTEVALGLVVEASNGSYVGVCANSDRVRNSDTNEC